MKIAFYSPHLNIAGTEVAMYDYAHFNESLLNNNSIIIHEPQDNRNHQPAVNKFYSRFNVLGISSFNGQSGYQDRGHFITEELNKIIEINKCDAIYIITGETHFNKIKPTSCKLLMHHVGPYPPQNMYGDVSAYCSEWLSQTYSNGIVPVVPHMINLPEVYENLRKELNIPDDAIVFGRNGGTDSFDIDWVKNVIAMIVNETKNIYFLFQNTDLFYNHPQIIHLPMNADLHFKVKFINTCDAMIHARIPGESFGLSCGEFSSKNKPVITYTNSLNKNHYLVLGNKGLYYSNPNDVYNILINFKKPEPAEDFNCYREFYPDKVMDLFNKVFLQK